MKQGVKIESTIRTYSSDAALVNDRREYIARAASKLFIAQGYHKTTVRQIAKACDMAMGTLYHYIGSKDDILCLIIDTIVSRFENFYDTLVASPENDPLKALKQAIDIYYKGIDEIQDLILILYQEAGNIKRESWQLIVDLEKRVFAIFRRILTNGVKAGVFSIPDIDLQVHAIATAGQLWAVRRWYLKRHFTLEEFISFYTNLFLKSLTS